jgi:hypothetical protein
MSNNQTTDELRNRVRTLEAALRRIDGLERAMDAVNGVPHTMAEIARNALAKPGQKRSMNTERFVMTVGAFWEPFPDVPQDAPIGIWDRQEGRPAATFHYANAICLEVVGDAPFTEMERWFNSLSNEELESEGLPVTK